MTGISYVFICQMMLMGVSLPFISQPVSQEWPVDCARRLAVWVPANSRAYTTYQEVPPMPRIPFNLLSMRPFLSHRMLVSVCFEDRSPVSTDCCVLRYAPSWATLTVSTTRRLFEQYVWLTDKIRCVVFINMTEELSKSDSDGKETQNSPQSYQKSSVSTVTFDLHTISRPKAR